MSFSYAWRILAAAVVVAAATSIGGWFGMASEPEAGPFVVGGTLREDGRIGKVTDVQGIVAVRPVLARRWTPVAEPVILKPSDWLRTDRRGANAVALRLGKDTQITLGPGTLVELVSPKQIKLSSGQLKIVSGEESPIELIGPDGKSLTAAGEAIYRVAQGSSDIETVDKPPMWLQGFEGATSQDSIGSLVVDVDGRNVPLTVGYHKVMVDIRDQIARTVIEESFVNRTDGRLEGVFYFPLPQDASISGFGMWIGDELVEADVVEKQRAREIYETILRERRDPGLLEWTGGNLFKARVFPIEAHSEKRIKITYTQVLPLKNGEYRYSYALQSEMLKLHPLRELGVEIKLASVLPLADVRSPTHLCRIDRTEHTAHVEFTAQEYSPDRDFELVVQLDGRQKNVVMIPHRRGDDGYFMLQLTPPGDDGGWARDTLVDGEPLDLLILADTSGSMDLGSRQVQAEFVRALFGCLTNDDRINLGTCDVDCDWAFAGSQPASDENATAAIEFLERRVSLGWTDLDAAFASALERCGPATHVIYVGDGVVTTGDADPVGFTQRLRRMCEGKAGSFHAVSVGSSFESIVLKAIAGLGGGSARAIAGEQTPAKVAVELLNELTRPTIRDLQVQFEGLRVARVYPEQLPNLPVGTQQILIGRYLPEGADQQGKVIVTGRLGDAPVRFSADVSLKDAEDGNSFLPRLWARMHLDALLEQGSSEQIKDEIIALSEEFNIITPYTSLLVLESDEDRERFGVKRRFRMRDGEKFFAEGRDQADYELMQQQMRLAGNWRLGLRRDVLMDLVRLGRDAEALEAVAQMLTEVWAADMSGPLATSAPVSALSFSGAVGGYGGFGGGGSGYALPGSSRSYGLGRKYNMDKDSLQLWDAEESYDWYDGNERLEHASKELSDRSDLGGEYDAMDPQPSLEFLADDFKMEEQMLAMPSEPEPANKPQRARSLEMKRKSRIAPQYGGYGPMDESFGYFSRVGDRRGNWDVGMDYAGRPIGWPGPQDDSWLTSLFQSVPPVPETRPFESTWPGAAKAISDGLLRTRELAELKGGLVVHRSVESFEPRWDHTAGKSASLWLVSPHAWLIADRSAGSQRLVQWCDGQRRGVYSIDLQLGRTRSSRPEDLATPPLSFNGWLTSPLEQSYATYDVKVRQQAADQVLLILKHPNAPANEIRLLVDTKRKVLLSTESWSEGKVASTTRFEDFVKIAGAWWATRVQSFDQEGRLASSTVYEFSETAKTEFDQAMAQQLASREQVQFIHGGLFPLPEAKQALSDGKADFEDRMMLALHAARIQHWDEVFEHLDAAEQLAADKPGMRWVRNAALNISRRREELRQRLMEEAGNLAADEERNLFLAEHVRGIAAGVFEANEMLALLDVLQPVFASQPAHLEGMKRWLQNRVSYLQQTGQSDLALELQQRLATEYPHDYSAQQQYARALAQQGDYDAAYAWLDRVTTAEARWLPYEEDYLRGAYADLHEEQGRFAELVPYLERWVSQRPENKTSYGRLLSALVKSDQEDKANGLIATWLREGREQGPLDQATISRLNAAVSQALGQGHSLYTNRLDEPWLEPLTETVKAFATHESQSSIAERIMQHWRFQQTDACRVVRRIMALRLDQETGTLTAAEIQRLVNWIWSNDPAVEAQVWRRLARELESRWSAEQDENVQHQLGGTLVQILSGRLTAEEHLAFLRRQLAAGPERYRTAYVTQLFDALLTQPWSEEFENEAFELLPRLSDATVADERLRVQAAALYRLTDGMVQARYDARMATVEHPENLTRTELREIQQENQRLAREGFVARLQAAELAADSPLLPWFQIERLYLQTQLGVALDRVREECWEALGPPPKADQALNVLEQILDTRYLATLCNLAVRRSTVPDDIQRLMQYVDQSIEAAEDEFSAFGWKLTKYQLLVALDQPKDLEEVLREWIRPEDADNYWRRARAYLLAEQGNLDEAIGLFERIEAADELWPDDYRALAGWYMAVDSRDKHERALIEVFKATDEYQLSNWLRQQLQPWQRRDLPMPGELDKDVLRVFTALFEKASQPQNYQWQLREFYQATHDFRLLACLGDAVVGHTAGRIYPFLESMRQVLEEIRDEATADSVIEHLAKVRQRAETAIDHRALDLLELLVERRSSEVLNQPGPHVARALIAMKRAFEREWSDGEPRLMADLLAALGRITQQPLADEQVRELEVLHGRSEKGTIDRLHIGHAVARAYGSYDRRKEAIDLLESELAQFERANGGVLPTEANGPLNTLIDYLEAEGHFVRGEKLLFAQLEHPVHQQQVYWLKQRLFQLYDGALEHDGETSLGHGQELYDAVLDRMDEELETPDHNHRYQLINRLCSIFRTCKRKPLADVADDLRQFAFQRLNKILGVQTNNYQSIVNQVAYTLRDVATLRDGLELLIVSIENEPSWFRLNSQDGWNQHGYLLAQWRSELGAELGDLAPRLLVIVIAELKRDLESQQQRNRSMYHNHHSYFWSEKAADFLRTAEQVYQQRRKSGSAVAYIAEYLFHGLDRRSRAIEILQIAYDEQRLDESGQARLVDYLRHENRFAETIPVLEPLVELRPHNIQYRKDLMNAYFHTNRRDKLMALLTATDEYFHEEGRWQEQIMATLGASCLENQLCARSVEYYQEAIDVHERTQPNRGIGQGTLSSYFSSLAQAHQGLGQTPEAVEAACGAIVSWGPRHDNRTYALQTLEGVIRGATDIDGFAAYLDEQAKETGLHNPIVRKALGKVYMDQQQWAKALPQLRLACEVQPNDTETHQQLVQCLERLGDKQGVIDQLLESLRLSRRDLTLYQELARRYELADRPEDAERARTSIVEALPNESEGHAALAEIRQQQNRWEEAAGHWQQVARIRALEPTGLLNLAKVQIQLKQWTAAAATIRQLQNRNWPPRFQNEMNEIGNLERQVQQAREVQR